MERDGRRWKERERERAMERERESNGVPAKIFVSLWDLGPTGAARSWWYLQMKRSCCC